MNLSQCGDIFTPGTPQNVKEYVIFLKVRYGYDRKDLINAGIPARYLK